MSTTNEIAKNSIVVGDGVVTTIPFEFNYIEDDSKIDIVVTTKVLSTEVEAILVEGVDYTIVGSGIVLSSALPVGTNLLIERDVENVQALDYDESSPFPAEVHEDLMDRVFMSLSELKDKFSRVPLLGKFVTGKTITIPEPEDGKFLAWDGTSGALKNEDSTVDLTPYYTSAQVDALQTAQDVASQAYADQAEADANTYTDGEIGTVIAAVGALSAADIENVPSGNLVATDVQAALNELQTEVDGISAASGEANTNSNAGTGAGLILTKSGVDTPVKSLITNIDTTSNNGFLNENANDITFNAGIAMVAVSGVDQNTAISNAVAALYAGPSEGNEHNDYGLDGATPTAVHAGRLKFYWTDENLYYTWNGTQFVCDTRPQALQISDIFKTGTVVNSSDGVQSYTFSTPFLAGVDSDIRVITNRLLGDTGNTVNAINITKTGFDLDRDDNIAGSNEIQYFAINGFYL